jgi:hypothetical protein
MSEPIDSASMELISESKMVISAIPYEIAEKN